MLIVLLLFIVCLLIGSKLTGQLFLGGILEKQSLSVQLLSGLIVIVSVVAVWYTAGKTILLPVVVLFLFQVLRNVKNIRTLFSGKWFFDLRWILLVSGILVFLVGFLVLLPMENHLILSGDYLFYGKLSAFMLDSGMETKNLNYFLAGSTYTEIYHYWDLWCFGLIRKVCGLNTNQSVYAGIFLVFLPLVFQALLDLFNQLRPSRFVVLYAMLATGVLLTLSGSTFLFNAIFGANEYGDFSGLFYPKLILLYAFFLVFISQVLASETKVVLILAAVFSLCFTTGLPVYTGLAGLVFLWDLRKNGLKPEKIKWLIVPLLLLIYLAGFYYLFSAGKQNALIYPQKLPLDGTSIKTRINILGKTGIYMVLGLMPLLVVLVWKWRDDAFKQVRALFLWMFAGSIIGLICWCLIFHLADAVQLWSNFYYSSIAVVFVSVLYFSSVRQYGIISLFLLVMIAIDVVLPKNNTRFLSSAQKETYLPLMRARIASFNDYGKMDNVFSANDPVFFSGLEGLMSFTDSRLISFSVPELKPSNALYEQIIRQSHLYQLKPFPIGKPEKEYISYQDSMFSELKIGYVAVHNNRSFPLVLKRWKLKQLKTDDSNYNFYQLVKRK
ncbi:hypothetical protein [Fluviicola sp.]|uniref:hypothetical protein n=1 Tax=Fluviicola sp. TaxID=1917219 RepID=UPI0031E177DF